VSEAQRRGGKEAKKLAWLIVGASESMLPGLISACNAARILLSCAAILACEATQGVY
jgi:hypothetical protein